MFEEIFQATIQREGGFKLHEIEGDNGRMTYAGISRKFNASWVGWKYIDNGDIPPTNEVREFYKREFWDKLNCDNLPPRIAAHIFDFGVNAGWKTSAKLAQLVIGVVPDGVIGDKSIAAFKVMPEDQFEAAFTIAKVKRYTEIVSKDKSQLKFLVGWLNRTLNALT